MKIAFIDDRLNRQESMVAKFKLNLSDNDIFCNFIGNKFDNLKSTNEIEYLKDYNIIIIHKSSLEQDLRHINLKTFCKESQKNLVLFSGSISNISFISFELDGKIVSRILEINDEILYSNLDIFLQSCQAGDFDIFKLAYGNKGELAYALEQHNKIKDIILKNEEYPANKFKQLTNNLIKLGYCNESKPDKGKYYSVETIRQIYKEIVDNIKIKGAML